MTAEVLIERKQGFFARRLKELRAAAGLSQPALAERSGVSVGAIRQFEQGVRRGPTYDTLVKLARGLGVSLAAFDAPADVGKPKGKRKRGKGG
jgi:transcriptional regulator with XRE-family HTH domain